MEPLRKQVCAGLHHVEVVDRRLLGAIGLRNVAETKTAAASPALGFAPPASATASANVSRARGKPISSDLLGAPRTEKLCGRLTK